MEDSAQALRHTPLHSLHRELGARMVPFAGYEMPVQYPSGILKEHNHTRNRAGLFDVSHMGQIRLTGRDVASALETLVPVDIIDLPANRQRYALFTNEQGGILDDLMVANNGDHLLLVVNAACKEQDIAHLRQHLGDRCNVLHLTDRALLALQGPQAAAVMTRLAPEVAQMVFMQTGRVTLDGADCYISRSGYTGEDGFEISIPGEAAEQVARLLLQQPEVAPIGLGARDSLRLEAGLCLYGHDIDAGTTPVEADLIWALSKVRRPGGTRAGGYPGAAVIERQLTEGVIRKRIGLEIKHRMPVREGSILIDAEGRAVGKVTSGGFGPSVNAPVAIGYVESDLASPGRELQAVVRDKQVPVTVAKLPFVQQRYYRG